MKADKTEVEIGESIDDVDDLNVNIDGFEKGSDEDEEYYRRRNDFHITDGKGDDEKISDFIFGGDEDGEVSENDDYTNDVIDEGLLDDADYDDEN